MPGKTSRVAIAGGAAPGVGRTIADSLLKNGYEVVILTRRSTVDSTSTSTSMMSAGFKKQQDHYTVRPIDYDDISDILSVLDADRIDTLISTIPSGLPTTIHLNLLEAAQRSKTVKRYIPSNWGAGDEVNSKVDRFRSKHEALKMLRDVNNNADGLEFTCILPGQYFMNYLAQGSPKNLHGEAMSGLYDFTIPVDVNGRTAEVGGDGNEPLVFTRLEDLAQGVVQVLEEEKWEYDAMWVVGDVVCWNEVIRLAERILNTKFSVTHLPLKDLEDRAAGMTPGSKEQMLVQLQACSARGELRPSPTHGTDKVKVIRPRGATRVEEFLEEWWGA